MWWSEKCPHRFLYLNTWSPVGGDMEPLGVQSCWRKCIAQSQHWEIIAFLHFLFCLSLLPVCRHKNDQPPSFSCRHAMIPAVMDSSPSGIISPNRSFLLQLLLLMAFITATERWLYADRGPSVVITAHLSLSLILKQTFIHWKLDPKPDVVSSWNPI